MNREEARKMNHEFVAKVRSDYIHKERREKVMKISLIGIVLFILGLLLLATVAPAEAQETNSANQTIPQTQGNALKWTVHWGTQEGGNWVTDWELESVPERVVYTKVSYPKSTTSSGKAESISSPASVVQYSADPDSLDTAGDFILSDVEGKPPYAGSAYQIGACLPGPKIVLSRQIDLKMTVVELHNTMNKKIAFTLNDDGSILNDILEPGETFIRSASDVGEIRAYTDENRTSVCAYMWWNWDRMSENTPQVELPSISTPEMYNAREIAKATFNIPEGARSSYISLNTVISDYPTDRCTRNSVHAVDCEGSGDYEVTFEVPWGVESVALFARAYYPWQQMSQIQVFVPVIDPRIGLEWILDWNQYGSTEESLVVSPAVQLEGYIVYNSNLLPPTPREMEVGPVGITVTHSAGSNGDAVRGLSWEWDDGRYVSSQYRSEHCEPGPDLRLVHFTAEVTGDAPYRVQIRNSSLSPLNVFIDGELEMALGPTDERVFPVLDQGNVTLLTEGGQVCSAMNWNLSEEEDLFADLSVQIDASEEVKIGESFVLTMTKINSGPDPINARWMLADEEKILFKDDSVVQPGYPEVVTTTVTLTTSTTFTATVTPLEGVDQYLDNNTAVTTVVVVIPGPPSCLGICPRAYLPMIHVNSPLPPTIGEAVCIDPSRLECEQN